MFSDTNQLPRCVLAMILPWTCPVAAVWAQQAQPIADRSSPADSREQPSVSRPTPGGPLTQADIEALKTEGKAKGWTFEVGHNSATDRSLDELCGLIVPPDWEARKVRRAPKPARDLPAFFDWRILRGTTSMKDQGACGSCWGFSAVAPLESAILIKENVEEDLAEQWLISCTNAGGCGGGWHEAALYEYLCAEQGAVLEEDFPYEAFDVACGGPYDHPYCIDDYYYVGDHYLADVPYLKQAILDYGPISVCIGADPAFQAYLGGVFNANYTEGINHCVALVGWDDNQGTNGVWLMRNSWGPDWGEYGYMRIEYGCSYVGYASLAVDYHPADCNHNGVPDDQDIFFCPGETWCDDCNGNWRLDACEWDCNGNGIPDDCDIASGLSSDVNANFLLDECETDCNGNGFFDFYELQEDLDADIDRNLVPDECQDCDGDGIWDWDDLGRPHGLLVVSTGNDLVRTFYPEIGSAAGSYGVGHLSEPYDVVVGPDRHLYVSSSGDNRVVELDTLGNYIGDLASCGTYPTGLAFGPDGKLYIASRNTNSVFRYDTTIDTCLGECVTPGVGGLTAPYGLTFDSQGHMFVSSSGNNRVIQYDLAWQFVRNYSDAALVDPRGLAFHPGGDLLVASYGTTEVLRFDTQTGGYVGVFTSLEAGPGAVQGLAYGPNGYLYVVTYGGGVVRIYEVNGETGVSWRTFNRADPDLSSPAGLAFYPPSAGDSNGNGVPDECDCHVAPAPELDYSPVPADAGFGTKNRYMTFTGGEAGRNQAVRVTFTSMPFYDGPEPPTNYDFRYAEGRTMWVQQPSEVTESSGSNGNLPPPTYWAATLDCEPAFIDWSIYDRVDVYDASIVPGATYDVQIVDDTCQTSNEDHYSEALSVVMSASGDVVQDCGVQPCSAPHGIMDFVDISAVVEKFKNTPTAVRKARADVINTTTSLPSPDRKVDFVDISCVVNAFRGAPCPLPGPPYDDPCP